MKDTYFPITVLGTEYRGHYVTSEEYAENILSHLQDSDTTFGLDTETAPYPKYLKYPKAALSPHLSDIRLLQVFDGKNSIIFDLKNISFNLLKHFLSTKNFVAHNAVFDLQYLIKNGVKAPSVGCTLTAAMLVIHATRPTDISLSLEALTENILGIDATKRVGGSDWSDETLTFEQIEYAALDPIYTRLLAEKLSSGIKKYRLEKVYTLCKEALVPAANIQLNGLGVDIEAHEKTIESWRNDVYYAREKVLSYAKLDKLTPVTLSNWLENNVSPDILQKWPRTDTGKLKTDAHTFSDFAYANEVAEMYSVYQKKEKLVNSFGDTLLRLVNPETKRIHSSYRVSGARTGRMTCSSPNLQQIPRDNSVRSIFIPPSGYSYIVADYNQIELRVAAELSQDKMMLKAYATGQDIHAITAANISRKPIDKITKQDRQSAKAVTFGAIYGIGSKKLSAYARQSYHVDIEEDKALQILTDFRELYSGYWKWFLEVFEESEQTLKVRTPVGKLRRLDKDHVYGGAANTKIQGGATEVLMEALVILQKRLDSELPAAKIVSCVHDEISIVAPVSETSLAKRILEESMVAGFLKVFPRGITKGLVKATHGRNWGEAKEG